MKRIFLLFLNQHSALSIGALASIALLSLFLIFQHYQSDVLKLESRWLLVAGVPLLAALIVGGYIKNFKGFGVELEASLSKPVGNLELTATEAIEELSGDDKRSISYLMDLKPAEKKRISRLVLVQGRPNYYRSRALEKYLRELKNVKYVEIRNQDGKFVALIPLAGLKNGTEINNNLLGEFIHTLEESKILQRYQNTVITTTVAEDSGLIDSLKLMRRRKLQQLVVLDESGVFVGVLLSREVEKRIVDDVLTAKGNA